MRLTEQAHKEISKFLLLGDMAIDATAGNGHDTKFLTQKVVLTELRCLVLSHPLFVFSFVSDVHMLMCHFFNSVNVV